MGRIGEVLQTARVAKGMTQADLASAAGVAQGALSRYEHDLRAPDERTVEALATALGVHPSLLDRAERIPGGIAVGAHMRRRATAPATQWRRLEAELNVARWHAERLRDDVLIRADLSLPAFDPLNDEAGDAAQMLRAQWRMPSGPIASVAAWLEAAGVLVIGKGLGRTARVDGLSQWAGSQALVIVNTDSPTDRLRMTLAHELGHLVMHSTAVTPDAEQQATDFAAEFLMPGHEIRPSLRRVTIGTLHDLKLYWGVSIAALIERANALGTITSADRTRLYKTLSARGWRRHEPGSEELRPEQPMLATHIANSLAARGLSDEEIATIAGFASARDNTIFRQATQAVPSLRLV